MVRIRYRSTTSIQSNQLEQQFPDRLRTNCGREFIGSIDNLRLKAK